MGGQKYGGFKGPPPAPIRSQGHMFFIVSYKKIESNIIGLDFLMFLYETLRKTKLTDCVRGTTPDPKKRSQR